MPRSRSKARRNPRSLPLPPDAQVVRVGQHEGLTHLYDPDDLKDIICQSGKNAGDYGNSADRDSVLAERRTAGAQRQLYPAYSKRNSKRMRKGENPLPAEITCYRCAKLASINIANGRKPWQRPTKKR
jgi:hypothetical protein